MQQTTKYHFNLIETSDVFSPDALNANARTAEAQLAAVRDEFAAGDAALATALSAAVGTGGKTCRIATGSYVGNGYSTAIHARSITVDFKPLVVFVGSDSTT